jgi:hypothetical protein
MIPRGKSVLETEVLHHGLNPSEIGNIGVVETLIDKMYKVGKLLGNFTSERFELRSRN